MQPAQKCEVRSDLSAILVEARRLYSYALSALPDVNAQAEEAANKRVERAREIYLNARTALQEHEAEHGCGFRPDSN